MAIGMAHKLLAAVIGRTATTRAFDRLWEKLLHAFPALQGEYIQVLVLLVGPLLFVLLLILADLKFGRRLQSGAGFVAFRPSLAVRFAYAFVFLMFLANLFLDPRHNPIIIAADLLGCLETLRAFPRKITVTLEGLRWRTFKGEVSLAWQHVAAFVKQGVGFGSEYIVVGDDGEMLYFSPAVFPTARHLVRRIRFSLEARRLQPSTAREAPILDRLHRWLLYACLLILLSRHLGYL